jgi:hypothetical protein
MSVSAPSFLTVVKAAGGRTPREQSAPLSGYEIEPDEFKTVKRRLYPREDVTYLCWGEINCRL